MHLARCGGDDVRADGGAEPLSQTQSEHINEMMPNSGILDSSLSE